ncbi:S8 family serine peptidase [Shimia aestuarii]|uniref:S8 family serine peptidase n=1 Tax=Shimia aestuarii TaxID=254406 RepID=UPI001FB1B848|nr:S8 family serine peptidase [Shimia aestuarii]
MTFDTIRNAIAGMCAILLLASCKPSVLSVVPNEGYIGSETLVTVNGEDFGTGDVQVTFGGVEGRVRSSTDTSIEAFAPASEQSGPVVVKVRNSDGTSEEEPIFTYVERPPEITSFQPSTSPSNVRTVICVEGQNLDAKGLRLFLGDSEPRILSRTDRQIIAIAEPQASSGMVRVESAIGDATAATPYTPDPAADLAGGELVVLKTSQEEKVGGPSAKDLDDAVRLSARNKDKILLNSRACGLFLGPELPKLPIFQILEAGSELRGRIANDDLVESIEPNSTLSTQTTESTKIINRDLIERLTGETPRDFGQGTAVAVLDTGVDFRASPYGCSVPGGSCRVQFAADFAPDDGQPDDDGHGTNVAAIITAIAPRTDILALDVFNGRNASTVSILAAMDWVIANQGIYDIVAMNLSLGEKIKRTQGECMSNDPYAAAAVRARLAGINVVAASGNSNWSDGMPRPACASAILSVGAVYDADVGGVTYPTSACTDTQSEYDQVACFSNHARWLKMLAPGAQILAAGMNDSGTSQAAPHVSGAIAALASLFPTMTPEEREQRLVSTGTPVRNLRAGTGLDATKPRLDLLAAIQGAEGRPQPAAPLNEAWPVAPGKAGSFGVVADSPSFKIENNDTRSDPISGLGWWPEMDTEEVHLQRAGYRCTRYGRDVYRPLPFLRLPTRAEALSLMDFTRLDGYVHPILGDEMAKMFWTSSPENRSGRVKNQWAVNYKLGTSTAIGLVTDAYARDALRYRCVYDRFLSAPTPTTRFLVDGDTVEDAVTGLKWMSAPLTDSSGNDAVLGYQEAAAACSGQTLGGERWRLPTVKELLSIMSYGERVLDDVFTSAGTTISATADLRKNTGTASMGFLGVNDQNGWIQKDMRVGRVRCVIQDAPDAAIDRHLAGETFVRSPMDMQALKSGQFLSADHIYIETKDSVQTVVLPGIKEIKGNLFINGNTGIEMIWLPDLETIGGGFEVNGNENLKLISAPRLKSVVGDLRVADAKQFTAFEEISSLSQPVFLPMLERIGGDFRLERNVWKPMKQIFFNALQEIGGAAYVSDNQELLFVGFAKLEKIGSACAGGSGPLCGSLFVERNSGFLGIRLSNIDEIRQGLLVRGNSQLQTVALSNIAPLGHTLIRNEVDISDNKIFCAVRFDGVIKKWPLNAYPTKVTIVNNAPSPSCKSGCAEYTRDTAADCPIFTNQ